MGGRHRWGTLPRSLLIAALVISVDSVILPGATSRAAGNVFTVNSTGDADDANIGDGVCATSTGVCTLRAAIDEAQKDGAPATIDFNIPGSGVQTIVLGSSLSIWNTLGLTIDGYTQPGAAPNTDPVLDNAKIMIQIEGNGPNNDAFDITGGGNTFRGLAIFNVFKGFHMSGSTSGRNRFVGDFIGTNAAGTFGYTSPTYGGNGIDTYGPVDNNQIGDVSAADRNVISGNAYKGISFENGTSTAGLTTGNIIYNNLIGLSPAGTPLKNNGHGIDWDHGCQNNIIGGTGPGQRNVISANFENGLEISHPGQDPTTGQPQENSNNQIIGNYIGTDATGNGGSSAYGNVSHGLNLEDGSVGTVAAYNVIGNNGQGGIDLYSTTTPNDDHVSIHDNRIGISLNGTAIPNSSYGISAGFATYDETIGPNNIITNDDTGIVICCQTQTVKVTQNSIYGNSNLGISIQSGNNNNIQTPVIAGVTNTQVTGTACGGCTVEVFLADRGAGQPGQGKTYLTTTTADGSGNWSAGIGISTGQCLTATATDSQSDTSMFALNVCSGGGGGATSTPSATATGTTRPSNTPSATATGTQPAATSTPSPTMTGTPSGSTGWSLLNSGSGDWLKGISCSNPSACFAVGDNGAELYTTNSGASWAAQNSGTTTTLYSDSCATWAVCIGVGLNGTIQGTSNGGSTWSAQNSGTTNTLHTVSCPSSTNCIAFGNNGTVLTTANDGGNWVMQNTGTSNYFYGGACPSLYTCIAVGGNGTILVTTNGGSTWSTQASPGFRSPVPGATSTPTGGSIWSTQANGTGFWSAPHGAGVVWAAQASGVSVSLRAAACPTVTTCFVVGDNGTIVATTNRGSSWTTESSGTSAALLGVSCVDTTTCYAVGAGGVIVATTNGGASWSPQPSGTGVTLYADSCTSTGTCYAAGDAGTILRRAG